VAENRENLLSPAGKLAPHVYFLLAISYWKQLCEAKGHFMAQLLEVART